MVGAEVVMEVVMEEDMAAVGDNGKVWLLLRLILWRRRVDYKAECVVEKERVDARWGRRVDI